METPIVDINWLRAADLNALKAALLNPAQREAVNQLLRTPEGADIAAQMINQKSEYVPVTQRPVEADDPDAVAADLALAEQQARDDAAAAAAAASTESPAPVVPVVEAPKEKIVVHYQVTDDENRPIGRPTHIEGWTWEEVSKKQQDAHINAVRYAERMKRNRATSMEAHAQQSKASQHALELQAEADAAIQAATTDATKLPEAIKKSTQAAAEFDRTLKENLERRTKIAKSWMADHQDDFVPCDANIKILSEWVNSNGENGAPLPFTYDSLELGFTAVKDRLAKPEYRPAAETPAAAAPNAPAVAPAAPAAPASITPAATAPAEQVTPPAAQPVAQPAVTAPQPTPAAAPNAQPAARRPGVNGGLQPGAMSAARPVAQQTPTTTSRAELLKQINRMSREVYKAELKKPEFRAKLDAAGIPYVSYAPRQ